MPTEILLGAAISGLVGFVLSVPAILLEAMRRVNNLPLLIDVKTILGRKLTDGETFVISLLLHLIVSTVAGGVYVWFAINDWLFVTGSPYDIHSILIFSGFVWLVAGFVLYPALGMGWFASKEGEHMWFEMLVTHLLLGLGFWLAISYYQPIFFFA